MAKEISGLAGVSAEEQQTLLEAPALIIALIGAADGNLDSEEREWGIRFARVQTYGKMHKLIGAFYEEAADHLYHKVQTALANLPTDAKERNTAISQKLALLNPILAKLEPPMAGALYKSFVGLADETAKSSGGIFRMGAISEAEAQWLKLPMLMPVAMPRGYEETEENEPTESD